MDNPDLAQKRRTQFILGISIILGLAGFFLLKESAESRGQTLLQLNGDSGAYKILIENFLKYKAFSFSSVPPLYPDTLRTPGYTLFMATLLKIFGTWDNALMIQAVIVNLSPLFLYLFARRLDERVAFISAIVFALSPTRLVWSGALMTDTAMTLTLLISIWFFIRWIKEEKNSLLFLSGLTLGLSVMFRPVAMLLWAPWLAVVLWHGGKRWKLSVQRVVIFLFGATLLVAPWSIRNKILFNTWQLSAIGSYSFAYANAIHFQNYKTGRPLEDLFKEFYALIEADEDPLKAVSLEKIEVYNRFAGNIIGQDPWGYLRWHFIKSIPYYLNDGLRTPAEMYGLFPEGGSPNFSNLFLRGSFISGVKNFAVEKPLPAALFLIGTVFWFFVTLAAYACIPLAWLARRKIGLEVWTLFLTVLYFTAVSSGPVVQPRYRLPIEGLMYVMAGFSLVFAAEIARRRLRKKRV